MDNLVKFYAIRIHNKSKYDQIINLLYSYGFHWMSGDTYEFSYETFELDWLFFKVTSKTICYSDCSYKFEEGDFQIFPEECEPLLKLKSTL